MTLDSGMNHMRAFWDGSPNVAMWIRMMLDCEAVCIHAAARSREESMSYIRRFLGGVLAVVSRPVAIRHVLENHLRQEIAMSLVGG